MPARIHRPLHLDWGGCPHAEDPRDVGSTPDDIKAAQTTTDVPVGLNTVMGQCWSTLSCSLPFSSDYGGLLQLGHRELKLFQALYARTQLNMRAQSSLPPHRGPFHRLLFLDEFLRSETVGGCVTGPGCWVSPGYSCDGHVTPKAPRAIPTHLYILHFAAWTH